MTTGAGLYLNPQEQDQVRINKVIQQVIEGRSNAVGSCTLNSTATTTSVIAVTCGPNSIVLLSPQTAHAASINGTTYVSSVVPGRFTVTHTSTGQTDQTFW